MMLIISGRIKDGTLERKRKMSRELKFRAWDTRKKIMYSAEEMGEDQLTLSVDGRGLINVNGVSTKSSTFLTWIIPMQFTGLHDKEGKEIYEGDWVVQIFETDLGGSPEQENLEYDEFEGVVMWENCGFVIDTKGDGKPEVDLSKYAYHLEVLGNPHKNPDLLKEK